MNFAEGVITLLVGTLIGGLLGFTFGCWLTRYEMGCKSYTKLKRERDLLVELQQSAIKAAEIQFIHHHCIRKPADAVEGKKDDSFDDWIPG